MFSKKHPFALFVKDEVSGKTDFTNSNNTTRFVLLSNACCRCQAVGKSSKPAGEPFFAINMTVRDYELDQYGVVNNAVYLNYLQHGQSVSLQRCKWCCPAYIYDRFFPNTKSAGLPPAYFAFWQCSCILLVNPLTAGPVWAHCASNLQHMCCWCS